MGLKEFVFDGSINNLDSLSVIFLRNNNIENIYFPDSICLNQKLFIYLQNNNLIEIPIQISKICSTYVLIDDNNVSILPDSIYKYKSIYLRAPYNALCDISDSNSAWLSRVVTEWPKYQKCE